MDFATPKLPQRSKPPEGELTQSGQQATDDLETFEFKSLKARVRSQDLPRLRPDGLLNPDLPPMQLCGGLESPYLLGSESPATAAQQPRLPDAPSL